jgi:hypothetical protein
LQNADHEFYVLLAVVPFAGRWVVKDECPLHIRVRAKD